MVGAGKNPVANLEILRISSSFCGLKKEVSRKGSAPVFENTMS